MKASRRWRARPPAAWAVALLGMSIAGVSALAWPAAPDMSVHDDSRREAGARSPERAVLGLLRRGGTEHERGLPWSRLQRAEPRFRGSREHPDGGLVLVVYADVRPDDAGHGMRCRLEVLTHRRNGMWHVTRVLREDSGCRRGGSPDRPASGTQAAPP